MPGLDINQPEIDFVELSHSLGVKATWVDSVSSAVEAVMADLSEGTPSHRYIRGPKCPSDFQL